MAYRHKQTSFVGLVVFDTICALAIVVLVVAGAAVVPIVVSVVAFTGLGAVVYALSVLTVEVDEVAVLAAFAWGWPRHSIALDDIVAVRQVRNRWYLGWGIRKVRHGWMYNVWGLDAVEVERTSGKVFRIGTDDAAALAGALSAACDRSTS